MKYCILPLLLLAVLCKKGDAFLLVPLAAPQEHLEIQFNGHALADPPLPEPDTVLTSTQVEQTPIVRDGCLFSHPPGLYARERGFKFKICIPEIAGLRSALEDRQSAALGRLEIREGSRAETAGAVGTADLVYRSRRQISLSARQERLSGAAEASDLPVTFPDSMPAAAAAGSDLFLIYELSDTRFLLIHIKDYSGTRRFVEALQQTEQLCAHLRQTNADVFVSEIYFSSQGRAFVEISSSTDGAANAVLTSDLGQTSALNGIIFADGAVVPEISFKARIDLASASGTATVMESEAPPGAGKAHSRTAEFPGSKDILAPSIACGTSRSLPSCHSRGIAPGQLVDSPALAEDAAYCSPDDFALRELNPFGFEVNGNLSPSGKFVEFEILRTCLPGRISIFAPLEIDPGSEMLAAGTFLVFAADSQFYEAQVRENSRIRSLAVDRPVQILSLRSRTSVTLFAGFPPEDLWIPRAGGRIHSLVLLDSRVLFHGPEGSGLRADAANAMSPGGTIRSRPGSAQLSELYPTGSYDSASIPGDEFFETSGQAGTGRMDLEVLRLRDGKRVLHHFPPSEGLTAYFAEKPVCFDAPWTKAALFLPNEAARYTLCDVYSGSTEEVEISQTLYAAMEKDRRSLARPWAMSAQAGKCLKSYATPSRENTGVAL